MRNILITFSLAFIFLTPVISMQNNNEKIEKILESNSGIKTLIVGCGKTPYNWVPSEESQNNQWVVNEDRGNHDHEGCLTLAETENVNPHIIWDWNQPAPTCLYNRFDLIYLEKLPPRLLEKKVCMENLWNCLKPGGRGVFDHQLYFINEENTYKAVSPFCVNVCKPDEETEKKLSVLTNLISTMEENFYKEAKIKKDAPMNKQQFEKLILNNPSLQKININLYKAKFTLNEIHTKFREKQSLEVSNLWVAIQEKANTFLKEIGFEDIVFKKGIQNSYNQRKNSTLCEITKNK